MRSRYSLAFALAVVAWSVFGVQAQTDWDRSDRKIDKQTRKQTSVRTIRRSNGVIVTTPDQVIVRPALRPNRPVIVRPAVPPPPPPIARRTVRAYGNNNSAGPNVFGYSDRNYEDFEDYENNRGFESNRFGNVAEVARLNGYRDGRREGDKDARDGEAYNPFGEGDYRDGATGYISRYRDREAYQQFYRQAFVRGYRESFDRYLGGYDRRNW